MDKLNKIVESFPVELKLLLVCCGSERWEAADKPSRTPTLKGVSPQLIFVPFVLFVLFVSGFGFRVPGFGFRVPGAGFILRDNG